jgi:anhydro-N-acetylmuramic acid kinase
MAKKLRVAGIMSGTSLDGIDVAIIDLEWAKGKRPVLETIACSTTPYSKKLRERILAVSNAQCHTGEIARLHYELPEHYAGAVQSTCEQASIDLKSLHLVGCHGQTVYHEGQRCSLQLGEPAVIAERLRVETVANFRAADIAAGGHGAPLVPFFDWLMLTHPKANRVALNLGGIANLHGLPAKAKAEDVVAFDSGPGNMVMDQLAAIATEGKQNSDKNARLASKGTPSEKLLNELLKDRWILVPPPKSAGREQYGAAFVKKLQASKLKPEDLLATATMFTAATIVIAISHHLIPRFPVDEVIASGGGVHNPLLMRYLKELLGPIRLLTSDDFGIPADAKEAIAFAVLAAAHKLGYPSNLPAATGARHAVVLGQAAAAKL